MDRMAVALFFCLMSIVMVVALYLCFWSKVEKVNVRDANRHSIKVTFRTVLFKLHPIKLFTRDIGEGPGQVKQQGAVVGGHHGSG